MATTTALPEAEACRILRVEPAGLAQLVRAGHLRATLGAHGYELEADQVHTLQPRAAGLVASLQAEVSQARKARTAEQLEQAQALAKTGSVLGGGALALIACAVSPGLFLPLITIGAGIYALGMPLSWKRG